MERELPIGAAHNWIDVQSLHFKQIDDCLFEVVAEAVVDFPYEGVAQSERFKFRTTARYCGLV